MVSTKCFRCPDAGENGVIKFRPPKAGAAEPTLTEDRSLFQARRSIRGLSFRAEALHLPHGRENLRRAAENRFVTRGAGDQVAGRVREGPGGEHVERVHRGERGLVAAERGRHRAAWSPRVGSASPEMSRNVR